MESPVSINRTIESSNLPYQSILSSIDWELSQKVKEANISENFFTVVYSM